MTLTSLLVLCIGFSLCPLWLMLRPTARLWRSVLGGSLLWGFCVLFLSDPRIRVGLLCCILLGYLWFVRGRMISVSLFSVSLLFRPNSRVACVYVPNRNPAQDDFFADVEARVDPSGSYVALWGLQCCF